MFCSAIALTATGVTGIARAADAGEWQPPSEAEVAHVVTQPWRDLPHRAGSLAERIVEVSEPFLGAPYRLSPLGEGLGNDPDPDPRLRFDAFDCTTFVETTLALALADELEEAQALLDWLRYREGRPAFLARRHFPAAEWLPELTALGFLTDITGQIGGDEVVLEKKRLNAEVWARRKRPTLLELPPERIPDGLFTLPVWPLDLARKGQRKIPPGTVLNVVRVDFRTVPVRVSHQGLVIRKGGKLYLRHAADRMFHAVVDEPLDRFFARMQGYRRWPVAGVHLAQVVEPPNWRARLAGRRPTAGATAPAEHDPPPCSWHEAQCLAPTEDEEEATSFAAPTGCVSGEERSTETGPAPE